MNVEPMDTTCPTLLLDRNRNIVDVIYLPLSSYVVDGQREWYSVPGTYTFDGFDDKGDIDVEWFVYEAPHGCFQSHAPFSLANGGTLTVLIEPQNSGGYAAAPCTLSRQWTEQEIKEAI